MYVSIHDSTMLVVWYTSAHPLDVAWARLWRDSHVDGARKERGKEGHGSEGGGSNISGGDGGSGTLLAGGNFCLTDWDRKKTAAGCETLALPLPIWSGSQNPRRPVRSFVRLVW